MTSQTRKVVLIGASRTGKTKAVEQLLGLPTPEEFTPTVGCEVSSYTAPSGNAYRIWDCAGLDCLGGLGEIYLLSAHIIIVCGLPSNGRIGPKWAGWIASTTLSPSAQVVYCNNINGQILNDYLP